jgi:hypothetical protein
MNGKHQKNGLTNLKRNKIMLTEKQHKEFKLVTYILVVSFCLGALLLKIFVG